MQYVAPELLLQNKHSVGYDAFKADVWSMGVILFAMLTGIDSPPSFPFPPPSLSNATAHPCVTWEGSSLFL